ncbi:SURF1 family protein [Sphingomonas piscis]|uniref:SURF1-like protein n=1 Tax=Sphingomonas piscis TaxID=2714943 RepID=A0A6G7YQD0_9SPHN|nr:SURF1 family protein [Sphingomonas piscis]QIK78937.1 SURF1 family protein [Sphingomonas piscis]
MRRLPILATIVVLLAAGTMVALGVWQIRRAQEKEALLTRYEAARNLPPVSYPTMPSKSADLPLYRTADAVCVRVLGHRATAGRNQAGDVGYSQIVDCTTGAEGPGLAVDIGWSRNPNATVTWSGGPVRGVVAPDSRTRMRLVAATAASGLQPSAPPSIADIPNNHRSYAVQWFLFAGLALLIYGLALRKRRGAPDQQP